MDRLDRQVIGMLERDGQMTNVAMAREVGASEETVRRRLKRLIESNALRVVAIPNDEMLGYGTKAIIGINVEPSLADSVASLLAKGDSVQWVMITTGQFDIMVQMVAVSVEDLYNIIRQDVANIVGVIGLHTMIGLSSPKVPYVASRNGQSSA